MLEPNITLKTKTKLNAKQEQDFLYAIEHYAPDGIIKDGIISKNKTKKYFLYTVYFTRNLIQNEAEFIVYAWDNMFKENYNIEITHDYIEDTNIEIEYIIDQNTLQNIIDIASRFLHNRWIDHKVSIGWRYGLYYSIKNKTDPKLRDWDSLPMEYKKSVEFNEKEAIKFYKENKNLFT